MEAAGWDAHGPEDHAATAPRLKAEDGSVSVAMAAAPQVGDGLTDYNPRGLSSEEDEEKPTLAVELEQSAEAVPLPLGFSTEEDEEKPNLAVKLEQSAVEAISVPFQGKVQIGVETGSSMDERTMNMDDDGDAHGWEDHVSTAPLKVEDGALDMAAAPEVGDGPSGYQPQGLSTEEDEEKPNLVVKLEQSVEDIPVPFEVNKVQIGDGNSSRMDERTVSMDDERRHSFLAESGSSNACHVANSVLSSKARNVTCGETFYSGDAVCMSGAEDKGTERSQHQWDGLADNKGGIAEVMRTSGDLKAVSGEAHCDHEGLSDSIKHGTKRWPHGADGVIFMTNDNYDLQQDGSMPKIEPGVDSVPSVSGRIDVSLNGNADRVGEISGDPVTCHLADGGLSNEVLCDPFSGVSQSEHSGCVYDMVDKAPEVSQCEESGLAGEGVIFCDGATLKTSLDDLQTCCNEQHCYTVGLSNLVKFDIHQLPHDMEAMLLKKDVDRELEKDGLVPKIEAKVSSPAHEDSVPSTFGRNLAAHLDGKDGETGEISEQKTGMGKGTCGALGVGMLSGESLGCPEHQALELNACNSIVDEPCSTVFIENGNAEELEDQNSESLSDSRRRNPRRSASSRNPPLEKHDQIFKGSNSSRKSKKVESSCSLVESTIIKFQKKITKVRSGINRPLKSTAWGSLQKLTGGFGENGEPSTSNSHPISLENGRSHKRSRKKEQPSVRKSRSSRCAKNKFPPFSAMGFASDELNSQPTFSVTTGTYASSEGYIGKFPRLDLCALVNGSDDAHKTAQCMSIQSDLQQSNRCLESVTQETCPAYICGDFAKSTSEPSLDIASVGFSPDSVLEVASATCENNTSASALSTSDSGKNLASSSTELEQCAQTVRGDENTRNEEINPSHAISGHIGEGKVQVLEKSIAARKSKKVGKQERQKKDGMKGKKGKNIKNRGSSKTPSKLGAFSDDSYALVPSVPPKSGSYFELVASVTQRMSMHEHESMQGPSVIGKEKISALDNANLPRRKESDDSGGKKDTMWDPYVKGEGMNKKIAGGIFFDSGSSTSPAPLVTDLAASHTNEQNGASVPQQPRAAWVCCDDCQKWRCIPANLADIIGTTNCRWTCKDNQDKTFAGCSIPQEKTNAEINAELDISDASADEADNDGSNSKVSRAPAWTHARVNSFLHRNRRNQSVDESMVCNCKPPQDGRMGCRDGCLNRMLNIECEKRTCPCGEQCSNQQFQRRSYAKISWFCSGKKGYGLELQEEVSEGRFLIEYVGEVLDITAYESRQRYYASKGQKHFYFMALNGGEVIDACTKGNLGRFVNHSCSPNCRTEKWMVNGEVCIGIFAMRNIKKGEELTFDYNYVRVSGAAPQKCFCGTAKCRGYIGGDISGSGIVSQDDAEAEHFQPIVTYKNAEEMLGNAYSHIADPNIVEHETSIQQEDSNDCPPAMPDSEPHKQNSPLLSDTIEPENSMEAWSPQDTEDVTRTPVHVSRTIESSSQQLTVYVTQPVELLETTPNPTDGLTVPNVMNRSTPSSDMGGSLVLAFHAKKENSLTHHRNVKPPCPIDNEHTLGVEGRLNSLLDRDGGISRRKDSTNEYLRLLVVTAAGGGAGGTSKSIRDLALILDALLQTKSGAVLLGIINMNGLQMLHNILKQNRDNFIRTPIIRKLLKVLEFLASRGILTAEKINEIPRLAGMESFRDSMLKLTRHSDKHVYPIARKFCDKWILPYMDGPANYSTHSYSARRKRKSRWDYQPENHYKMVGLQTGKVYSGHRELDLQTSLIRYRLQGNWLINSNHNDGPVMGSSTDGADDDVPPGFGADDDVPPGFGADDDVPPGFGAADDVPPGFGAADDVPPGFGADDDVPPGFEPQQDCQPAQASLDLGGAPGFCQERYLPNLSNSSGIPGALIQHFGTPEVEGTQCGQKWKVAPGMPFNPPGSPCPSTSSTHMSHHDGSPTMKHNSSGYRGRGADRGGRVHRSWRNGERTIYPYDNQGGRFPSNHHRA